MYKRNEIIRTNTNQIKSISEKLKYIRIHVCHLRNFNFFGKDKIIETFGIFFKFCNFI